MILPFFTVQIRINQKTSPDKTPIRAYRFIIEKSTNFVVIHLPDKKRAKKEVQSKIRNKEKMVKRIFERLIGFSTWKLKKFKKHFYKEKGFFSQKLEITNTNTAHFKKNKNRLNKSQ